jgi:hypothetical protein
MAKKWHPGKPCGQLSVIGWYSLALAGVSPVFTQKSHAALRRSLNTLTSDDEWLPSGIFDSHRPLHFQAMLANETLG